MSGIWKWMSAVLGAAALVAAPALAAPSRTPDSAASAMQMPLEGVVTNPDWLKKPTGEEMANYYPPVASTVGINGHATLECEVQTSGLVANCQVLSEEPEGMGFGNAALALAKYFQMKPMTVDGAPVGGGKVVVPIGFLIPPDDQAATPPPPSGPEPTPKALAAARQIVQTSFGDQAAAVRSAIAEHFSGYALTEQEQAALDDYVSASQEVTDSRVDATARLLTQYFNEGQLADVAAFYASPAGQAWNHQSSALNEALNALRQQANADAQRGAVRRFCADHLCQRSQALPEPVPAGPARQRAPAH